MADTTPFRIGAEATCVDGKCGQLTRVVLDPVARTLTHLVIEPKDSAGPGRLVPVDLVETATIDHIHLRCDTATFATLSPAEETHFLTDAEPDSGYAVKSRCTAATPCMPATVKSVAFRD